LGCYTDFNMRILIDIGHPSFVHVFKHFAWQMQQKNHEVLFSVRTKDHTEDLLNELKFNYKITGRNYKTVVGKIWGLFINTIKLSIVTLQFKPKIVFSGSSPYASIVSLITLRKHVLIDDTENREQIMLYRFGASIILTPDCFSLALGRKHVRYPGYHEHAYLKTFIRNSNFDIPTEKPVVFMRFVDWKATHDIGIRGITDAQKLALVKGLASRAHIVISSEKELPAGLTPYAYNGKFADIHDVLAQASAYFGESATMASEAACLNVPAIYLDPTGRCYTRELEDKYGLVRNFTIDPHDFEEAVRLLNDYIDQGVNYDNSTFMNEKINLTFVLVWLTENRITPALLKQMQSPGFFENNLFKK
jgi:uncharacterized protein